jgi:hypothetical protein
VDPPNLHIDSKRPTKYTNLSKDSSWSWRLTWNLLKL